MPKPINRTNSPGSENAFARSRRVPVDNFFGQPGKRIYSSPLPAIFVTDIPLETVPERVSSPDLVPGGCRHHFFNP